MEKRLLTPEEIAERLQISRLTVMSYLRSGVLKGIKVGRLWRVSEEDLRAFLKTSGPAGVWIASDAVSSDDSDSRWLEADLGGPLPPWDWGPAGKPAGKPVRYVPGVGLVIEGKKRHGE